MFVCRPLFGALLRLLACGAWSVSGALPRLLACVAWSFVLAQESVDVRLVAQQAYLKPSNTGSEAAFGSSVSVWGNTVVVGAASEKSCSTGINGDQQSTDCKDAGAGYIFQRNELTAQWSQEAYLKPANKASGAMFGNSVDVWENTVVVGAFSEASCSSGINQDYGTNVCTNAGAVYIMSKNESTGQWFQEAYLKPRTISTNNRFGSSVSVWESTVVVGSVWKSSCSTGVNGDETNTDQCPRTGAAYVFSRNKVTGKWFQEAFLKPGISTRGFDFFGNSVSIWNDIIVVGALNDDSCSTGINGDASNGGCPDSGAAYIFSRNEVTGQWSQEAYLKPSNTGSGNTFGFSVSIWRNIVVVGAPRESSCSTMVKTEQNNRECSFGGAAYVLSRNEVTGQWSQEAYLKPSNMHSFLLFGASISIWGGNVVVGAPWENSCATGFNGYQYDDKCPNAGAAYMFSLNQATGQWFQQGYLKASNTGEKDMFAYHASLWNGTVVMGAASEASCWTGVDSKQTDEQCVDAGAAYVFAMTDNSPVVVAQSVSPSPLDVVLSNSLAMSPSPSPDTVLVQDENTPIVTYVGAVVGGTVFISLYYYCCYLKEKRVASSSNTSDKDDGSSVIIIASEFATILHGNKEVLVPTEQNPLGKLAEPTLEPSLPYGNGVDDPGHSEPSSNSDLQQSSTETSYHAFVPAPHTPSEQTNGFDPKLMFPRELSISSMLAMDLPVDEPSYHSEAPCPEQQFDSGSPSPRMSHGSGPCSVEESAHKERKAPNWVVLAPGVLVPSQLGTGQVLITLDDGGNAIFWKPEAKRLTGEENSASPTGSTAPESIGTTFPPTPADPEAKFYPRFKITLKYKNKQVQLSVPCEAAHSVGQLKEVVALRLNKDISSFTLWCGNRELVDVLEELPRFREGTPDQALNYLVEARNMDWPLRSGMGARSPPGPSLDRSVGPWNNTSNISPGRSTNPSTPGGPLLLTASTSTQSTAAPTDRSTVVATSPTDIAAVVPSPTDIATFIEQTYLSAVISDDFLTDEFYTNFEWEEEEQEELEEVEEFIGEGIYSGY
eukprot:gb/GEZN01001112.1/.p1 GENE.gb/GEZN01001112.1/~~gb/GEZN01001112.1/.p1  ORF type:complete len:1057 (+),score=144.11 gb/GEZN01001112.1/:113-3283(+)